MTHHIARAEMLIRHPVGDVFDAFVEPQTLTQFWLEAASAPLASGATVSWRFKVPGASETVTVTAFEPPRLIAFDWSDGVHVRLGFAELSAAVTLVTAEASGFAAEAGSAAIVDATEGFSIVLCDLKTLLETGRSANLVRDKAELIAARRRGAEPA